MSIMEQQIQLNDHNKQEYPPMHTCEHIVNRTMMNLFGCGRSVSAHIERKKSKLDYALETAPTEEDVKRLEEAQGRFDLKRLPEDASETVRIVKVGNYDECLCLGTHVKNTSEVGTFKVISHDWNEEAKRWRMRFKLQ